MTPILRKSAIVVVAILALVAGVWEHVVTPLHERRASLERAVLAARETFEMAERILPRLSHIPSAGASSASVSGGIGTSAERVQAALKRFALSSAASRLEPRDDGVVIQFDSAPFGALVAMMAFCETQYGLATNQLQLTPASRPGHVSGTLIVVAPSR